jgi:hypothetical protein
MSGWTIVRGVASVIVFATVPSFFAGRAVDRPRVATGTIAELHAGDWLSIANDQFEPFPLTLHGKTRYEDQDSSRVVDPSTIRSGIRATVWYRNVGERRLVVDKVRVLDGARSR